MSDERLQNLETVVRALRDEVRRLSEEVARLGGNGSRAPERPALRPEPAAAATSPVKDRPQVAQGAGASGVATAARQSQAAATGGPGERSAPAALEAASTARASAASALDLPGARGAPPVGQGTAGQGNLPHPNRPRYIERPRQRQEIDFEAVVGRYGTLAIAAILVVMGVGAFVTWAATRIVIGPAARVALGAGAALVIALVGRRMIARGSVTFGSTLLALALAVMHVDAWAAGPVLNLVPNTVALGSAALASVALAALAIRERNEMLFAVGLSGAIIAPFVTGDSSSPVLLLVSYGWVVIASALAVAKPREWVFAAYMVAIGGLIYASASVDASRRESVDLLATGLFPIACAWAAFLWGGERRRATLSLWFAALGAIVTLALAIRYREVTLVAIAVIGTASIYAHLEARAASRIEMLLGLLAVPLAFLLGALVATEFVEERGILLSLAWAIAAFLLARLSRGRRDIHYVTAVWAAVAAILFALHDRPVACVVALSAAAAGIAYLAHREDSPVVMVAAFVPFALAAPWANLLMFQRPAFDYTPFLTQESLAGASVAAAGFVGWRLITERAGKKDVIWMPLFLVPLFFWIRAELVHAIRPEVATFLLILYYAMAGVLIIVAGRRWEMAQLRIAGLLLAIYAAAKALVEASGLTMIGLRVGSYLLVGGFLLAVAYWYRAASAAGDDLPVLENQRSSTQAVGM